MIRGMVPGALFARLINDSGQRQAMSTDLEEPSSAASWFSVGAWTIAPGSPPSLTPVRKTHLAACMAAIATTPSSVVLHAQARPRVRVEKEKAQVPLGDLLEIQKKTQEELLRAQGRAKGMEASENDTTQQAEEGLSKAQLQARARMWARERRREEQGRQQAERGSGLHEPRMAGVEVTDKAHAKELVRDQAEQRGWSVWQVVYKPHVAVRASPKHTARIVGALYPGEEVAVSEALADGWLCVYIAPARPPGAEIPTESWVLAYAGSGQAVMLEKVST